LLFQSPFNTGAAQGMALRGFFYNIKALHAEYQFENSPIHQQQGYCRDSLYHVALVSRHARRKFAEYKAFLLDTIGVPDKSSIHHV